MNIYLKTKKLIPFLVFVLIFCLGLGLNVALSSCTSVPITGRQQLSMISNESMHNMSFQQYDKFLKTNATVSKGQDLEMVRKVGRRIQAGVEQYFKQQGRSNLLAGYEWEFNLVKAEDVNAWCMPGGKVVVYTGLLPVAQTEEGLAVVMGHEIAHAVARHGAERMSQQMILQMGGAALSKAVKDKPQKTQAIWATVFGVGSKLGFSLPYSRIHESEADHMGLIFMAMAGYNPESAVSFWRRMSQLGGKKPPEFLSTHPSNETRISDIKTHLPEAMQYYKK